MLGQYVTVKAIQEALSRPNKEFSVRGLASEIGISPGSSRAALEYMEKKGLVRLRVVGKSYQYRANLESALCRQWKQLFNLDYLAEAGIVEELLQNIPNVHSILLYGSFARGTNDEKSDIDLLVIANKRAETGFGFGKKLGREVNLSVFSLGDWKRKAAQDKVFYENVVFDSVVLYGERPVVL